MNSNQNSVFIVSYCSETIEGKGPMETVAITASLEEAKRISEFEEVYEDGTGWNEDFANELKRRFDAGEYITQLFIPYDCLEEHPNFIKTYTQFGVEILSGDD